MFTPENSLLQISIFLLPPGLPTGPASHSTLKASSPCKPLPALHPSLPSLLTVPACRLPAYPYFIRHYSFANVVKPSSASAVLILLQKAVCVGSKSKCNLLLYSTYPSNIMCIPSNILLTLCNILCTPSNILCSPNNILYTPYNTLCAPALPPPKFCITLPIFLVPYLIFYLPPLLLSDM